MKAIHFGRIGLTSTDKDGAGIKRSWIYGGYGHSIPLDQELASGAACRNDFIDTPETQKKILRGKNCGCDVQMEEADMDSIYRELEPDEIPWNIEEPPGELVELIEGGAVKPCRAIDLGCGAGNYAIYLAGRGFDVTGVDYSPAAIEIARSNAVKKGVECSFVVADLLGDLGELDGGFEFAYDWEVMHHIRPDKRRIYVENVYRLLDHGALYLSVCFSDMDEAFPGKGKVRKTPLGTVLYLSSERDLGVLFGRLFEVRKLRTVEIRGKTVSHLSNCALMKKE